MGLKSKSKVNDETDNYNDFVKNLIKFYKIDLKQLETEEEEEEEVTKMTKKQRKEYESRHKKWMALFISNNEFEVHKCFELIQIYDQMIGHMSKKAEEYRADPKYEELYKDMVERNELDAKEVVKHLDQLKKTLNDRYNSFKKQKFEELLEVKEEEEEEEEEEEDNKSESETDIDIKDEYISEDEIKKEEKDYDDKTRVKKEIKTENDVKPYTQLKIKSEVKSEIKSEFKPVIKKEYISSDEESK